MLTLQQKQAAIVRNKARIVDLLKWSADQYHIFLWNTGIRYLNHYIGRDEVSITKINSRKEFWNWWINLFDARNEAFIEEWDGLEDQTTVDDLRKLYQDIHNPAMLACEIKPPQVVYGNHFTKIQMANNEQ